jgi:hypothetical protein
MEITIRQRVLKQLVISQHVFVKHSEVHKTKDIQQITGTFKQAWQFI